MNWDNPIDEALNDAHSILSLIFYRGYSGDFRSADKDDVDRALRAVIRAEESLKAGQYSVVKVGEPWPPLRVPGPPAW